MRKIIVVVALLVGVLLMAVSPVFAQEPGVGAALCVPVGAVGQGGFGCQVWPAGYREVRCSDGFYTWTSYMVDYSCIGRRWLSTYTW